MLSSIRITYFYILGLIAASILGIRSFHILEFSQEFGLSSYLQGFVVSSTTLVGACFGILIGLLIEKIGQRASLLVGLSVVAVSSAWTIWLSGIVNLIFASVLSGIGFTVLVTAIPAALSAEAQSKIRDGMLTMWGAYLPLGAAIGIVWASSSGLGWQINLLLHGLISIVCAIGVFAFRLPKKLRTGQSLLHAAKIVLMPGFQRYAIGFFSFAAIFLSTIVLLPSYVRSASDLTDQQAGIAVALICVVSAVTCVLLAIALPKIASYRKLLSFGFLGSAISGVSFFALESSPVAAVTAAVAIFLFSSIIPATVFYALPRLVEDQQVASASGVIAQAGSLGSFVGPPMTTHAIESYGLIGGSCVFVAFCIVGVIAFTPLSSFFSD